MNIAMSARGQSGGSAGGAAAKGAGLASGGMPGPASFGLAGLQAASSYAGMLSRIGQIKRNADSEITSDVLAAQDADLNARQAIVSGYGKVAGLRQQFAAQVGQRAALASASGVDAGQGVVQDNAGKIEDRVDAANKTDLLNADIESRRSQIAGLVSMMKAYQTRSNADAAASETRTAGMLEMATSAAKLLL